MGKGVNRRGEGEEANGLVALLNVKFSFSCLENDTNINILVQVESFK